MTFVGRDDGASPGNLGHDELRINAFTSSDISHLFRDDACCVVHTCDTLEDKRESLVCYVTSLTLLSIVHLGRSLISISFTPFHPALTKLGQAFTGVHALWSTVIVRGVRTVKDQSEESIGKESRSTYHPSDDLLT